MKESLTNYIKNEISNIQLEEISSDDELFSMGIIDSLGMMRLISFIEQEYQIQIPFQDITVENFSTVDRMINYLSSK